MGSIIRVCAMVASLLLVAGFLAFAADESSRGSDNQVREAAEGSGVPGASSRPAPPPASLDLLEPAPSAPVERRREAAHGGLREAVDDAGDVLLAPFTGLIDSENLWVQRLVPTALALLLFGLGGLFLANLAPKRSRGDRDWREARS